jgi:hypothetical protein
MDDYAVGLSTRFIQALPLARTIERLVASGGHRASDQRSARSTTFSAYESRRVRAAEKSSNRLRLPERPVSYCWSARTVPGAFRGGNTRLPDQSILDAQDCKWGYRLALRLVGDNANALWITEVEGKHGDLGSAVQ